MIVTGFAPAKVNLHLHVGHPLADGRHPLDSFVAFAADVGDWVSAAPAPALELEITGPFSASLSGEGDNLVLRAARLLAEAAGVSACAAITLDKRLPVASGIGGGSADAAATLRVLNRLWALGASEADLERLAAGLGADVPSCVGSRPVRMSGTGETLAEIELPPLAAVLVNPGVPAPTGQVYRTFDELALGAGFSAAPELSARPEEAFAALATLANDLDAPARRVAPAIGDVLAALRDEIPRASGAAGSAIVRMSGSGATCFLAAPPDSDLAPVVAAIAAKRPDWWVVAARLERVDVTTIEG